MKKTTLASLIIAAVAFVLFGVSIAFIKWDSAAFDATPSEMITCIIAFAAILCAFIIFEIVCEKKNKTLMILPVIGVIVLAIIFSTIITANINYNQIEVLDFIAPTTNMTVFSFLLFVTFIVSLILYFLKGYKWTAIVAITYLTILLIYVFNYSVGLFFGGDNKLTACTCGGTILALIALAVYFIAPFTNGVENKAEVKEETSTAETIKEEKVSEEVEEEKAE